MASTTIQAAAAASFGAHAGRMALEAERANNSLRRATAHLERAESYRARAHEDLEEATRGEVEFLEQLVLSGTVAAIHSGEMSSGSCCLQFVTEDEASSSRRLMVSDGAHTISVELSTPLAKRFDPEQIENHALFRFLDYSLQLDHASGAKRLLVREMERLPHTTHSLIGAPTPIEPPPPPPPTPTPAPLPPPADAEDLPTAEETSLADVEGEAMQDVAMGESDAPAPGTSPSAEASPATTREQLQSRVRQIFNECVAAGTPPNEAAALALDRARREFASEGG